MPEVEAIFARAASVAGRVAGGLLSSGFLREVIVCDWSSIHSEQVVEGSHLQLSRSGSGKMLMSCGRCEGIFTAVENVVE